MADLNDEIERHGRILSSIREMDSVLSNEIMNSDLASPPSDLSSWDEKRDDIRRKLQWVSDEIANLKSRDL